MSLSWHFKQMGDLPISKCSSIKLDYYIHVYLYIERDNIYVFVYIYIYIHHIYIYIIYIYTHVCVYSIYIPRWSMC